MVENAAQTGEAVVDLPVVLSIRPGLASEKSLKIPITPEQLNGSLGDAIKYALNNQTDRKYAVISDAIKKEMTSGKAYGMVIGSKKVNASDNLGNYVTGEVKETSTGTKYKEIAITIASEQAGGDSTGLESKL